MKKPRIREANGPEEIIQTAIVKYLELRGWTVMETHGNLYQKGFPDIYALHPVHKQRWIEVKNPLNYVFTKAQEEYFPIIGKCVGVWIMVAATDAEYQKLFEPQNWWTYL